MPRDFQSFAALAVVFITVGVFAWKFLSLFRKKKGGGQSGCGGSCACDLKPKLPKK